MSEKNFMWVEIIFNTLYLIVIWRLVVVMFLRRGSVDPEEKRTAGLFTIAFLMLALGDMGHVGFRVVAFLRGDLSATVQLMGKTIDLIGLGALANGYTITIFYMLMLEIWHERFETEHGVFSAVLLLTGLVGLGVMALPFNQWSELVPVQPWSTIRNMPLMIQGLGVTFLILRDGIRAKDRTFWLIALSILVSYACYIPVVLYVQRFPLLGILMIPKTLAYIAVAVLAYRELYPVPLFGEKEGEELVNSI